MLQEQYPRIVVPDDGISNDPAVLIHDKCHDCFIQSISAGSKHLTESILAWNNRNIRNFSILIGFRTEDHFSLFTRNFDQRTWNCVFPGDIRFRQCNGIPDQFIMHLFRKCCVNLLILRYVFGIQLYCERLCIQSPAFRSSQLADIVPAMREVSFKGQDAIRVCPAFRDQGISQQCPVQIVDIHIVIKAEGKPFSRHIHN